MNAFAADRPLYAVLVKSLSNQFFSAAAKGVDEGARKADVDKPAVMIAAAINSVLLLPCLKHFNEAKIPVVDLDNNLDPQIAKKAGVEIAFHIGSDNDAAGANVELQATLNPAGERKVERFGWTFAPGDKVMQIENDYDKEVYNADIGYVDDVDREAGELIASFDGRSVTYEFGELDALVPAYSATIHKPRL